MSRKALWAPRELDSWDWRAATIDEDRQPQRHQFPTWRRPDRLVSGSDPVGSNRLDPSIVIIWFGFAAAALAAMAFALSAIYGQMIAALTGVAVPAGLPLRAILVLGASGLLVGAFGVVVRARRHPRDEGSGRQDHRPDARVAA